MPSTKLRERERVIIGTIAKELERMNNPQSLFCAEEKEGNLGFQKHHLKRNLLLKDDSYYVFYKFLLLTLQKKTGKGEYKIEKQKEFSQPTGTRKTNYDDFTSDNYK